MGTPAFAVPPLQALAEAGHDIVAVYTQPPRPKGRGQQLQASPVQQEAERLHIPVRSPKSLKKDTEARAEFAALNADLAVVAAYGLILPQDVLDAPAHGCLNIHASLLPRWRGASPIQHAIQAGDHESGITVMQMEAGLDTGPMIAKGTVPIHDRTNAQDLHDELSALGARMIVDTVRCLETEGILQAKNQDDTLATYAPLLTKDDGRIDWSQDASIIDRQVRALTPWPGVWTTVVGGGRLKILDAMPMTVPVEAAPGTLINRDGHVACGQHTGLRLLRVQPENAKAMDCASAFNGGYLNAGLVFA